MEYVFRYSTIESPTKFFKTLDLYYFFSYICKKINKIARCLT
nr:MAG TPA: hypothetical protein [Crassvirales sp.]